MQERTRWKGYTHHVHGGRCGKRLRLPDIPSGHIVVSSFCAQSVLSN